MNRQALLKAAAVAALMLLAGAFLAGGVFQMGHHLASGVTFLALGLASLGGAIAVQLRMKGDAPSRCSACGDVLETPDAVCPRCAAAPQVQSIQS